MHRGRARLPATLMLVLLAGTGCSSGSQDNASDGNPLPSDSSFVPVTDTVAGALTDAQAKQIADTCRDEAGIPGSSRDCTDSIPSLLPVCRPTSPWCLTGHLGDDHGGEVRLIDQRGASPVCAATLCSRVLVPGDVVRQMVAGRTPAAATSPSTEPPPSATSAPSDPSAEATTPTSTPTP